MPIGTGDAPTVEPMISVIMPSFNCREYLAEALDSVAAQQVSPIEVLVVDDGSTDGSRQWLAERAAQDPSLRVIHTERAGPAGARNLAISQARGLFTAFLDADDVWHTDKLAAQLRFHLKNPDVVLSFTNYQQVDPSGHVMGNGFANWERFGEIVAKRKGYRKLDKACAVLFVENPVGTSTVMARTDVLQKQPAFDEQLPSAEDLDLWLRLCGEGEVGFTDACKTDYLVRPGSESSHYDRRLQALETIHQRYLKKAVEQQGRARFFARARLNTANAHYQRHMGQHLKAFALHSKAFCWVPRTRTLKAMLVDLREVFRGPKTPIAGGA